jgi:FdhD protein
MTRSDAVDEVPWCLDANDVRIASGTASPGHSEALGAGRMVADGYVERRHELLSIGSAQLASGALRVQARITDARFEAARAEAHHRSTVGCGLLHFISCDPSAARMPRHAQLPDAATTVDLLRSLFAACDEASPAGGVHGAALVAERTLLAPVVDVSRHAAIEKVVGAAFLADNAMADCGLVLTARISGQIALTAARAGVGWVASRSLATTLAIAIARAARLPLITRAAGRDRTVIEVEAW